MIVSIFLIMFWSDGLFRKSENKLNIVHVSFIFLIFKKF